jgi:Peptidase_C39 like family
MKKSSWSKYLVALVLFLGFAISDAFAYRDLDIPAEKQSCTEPTGAGTCWAACCDMILNAYAYSTNQLAIASWAADTFCSGNIVNSTCDGNDLTGTCTSCDIVLQQFGPIGSDPVFGNLSQSDLDTEIDIGHPIIANLQYSTYAHDVLITGYDGTGGYGDNADVGDVIYNDPQDNTTGHLKPFASFVQTGNTFKWAVTLRMVTDPETPIGTPVGGTNWVQVNSGGTTVITPSTGSLSYSALCSSFSSRTWKWNLILSDIIGDVIVASATQSTSNKDSTTWNIANFSLPTGHHWNYNFYGKIPGRVEITAIFGSTSVKDAKDVVYVPSVLFPGNIVSVNQTISSSQADVKAHNSIQIVGDQITSTGTENLKAGQSITILPETKILPGSKVNITIDPTLQ